VAKLTQKGQAAGQAEFNKYSRTPFAAYRESYLREMREEGEKEAKANATRKVRVKALATQFEVNGLHELAQEVQETFRDSFYEESGYLQLGFKELGEVAEKLGVQGVSPSSWQVEDE
jgi:hypothetical protein